MHTPTALAGRTKAMAAGTPLALVVVSALAVSGCNAPPAASCQATAAGTLDTSCAGPQCVAAIVVDYKRVTPRGYRVFALAGAAVNAKTAEARAVEHIQQRLGAPPPDQTDTTAAGDFYLSFLRYDSGDSWLVVIHAPTGQVLFAGLEVWADALKRGYDFPLPDSFRDASGLGCTADGAAEPASKKLVTTGVPLGSSPASTAADAWDVARRLNLTAELTRGYRYTAMVVSFAPAAGELDAESADWYVWLNRLPL